MAKFQNNSHQTERSPQPVVTPPPMPVTPPPAPVAFTHPTQVVRVAPPVVTPPPAPVDAPVLIQKNNAAMGGDLVDIMHDSQSSEDRDKPNTKHTDTDFAPNSAAFVGGKRMIQTDALARALNADCYLLDVPKDWGHNPLGGRPVSVYFTREFPGKGILYDNFESGPETSTRERVDKLVAFKMKLANEHGFIYLYQHAWVTLTTDALDKQLAEQKETLKSLQKK